MCDAWCGSRTHGNCVHDVGAGFLAAFWILTIPLILFIRVIIFLASGPLRWGKVLADIMSGNRPKRNKYSS